MCTRTHLILMQTNKIVDVDVHNRLRELARVFVQYCEMSKTLSKETIDQH